MHFKVFSILKGTAELRYLEVISVLNVKRFELSVEFFKLWAENVGEVDLKNLENEFA